MTAETNDTQDYTPTEDEQRIIDWLGNEIGKDGFVPGIILAMKRGEHRA